MIEITEEIRQEIQQIADQTGMACSAIETAFLQMSEAACCSTLNMEKFITAMDDLKQLRGNIGHLRQAQIPDKWPESCNSSRKYAGKINQERTCRPTRNFRTRSCNKSGKK